MIPELKNNTILLHGLSGAGKGELQRVLRARFNDEGYCVTYVSSGDKFREALNNPTILEHIRKGYFIDTLGAIMPSFKKDYHEFLENYVPGQKAILIADGMIRRSAFLNKEGSWIPSQVVQIAEAMDESIRCQVLQDRLAARRFPEYFHSIDTKAILKEMLIASNHVLLDILPEDAKVQMVNRAMIEVCKVEFQLTNINIESSKLNTLVNLISSLKEYLTIEGCCEELSSLIINEVENVRKELARLASLDEDATLMDSLRTFGIQSTLRDDDLTPFSRQKRVDSYLKISDDGYVPGFASKVLIDDLGFGFKNGSFLSDRPNLHVLKNGQSYGIDLDSFRRSCATLATEILNQI